MWVVGKNSDGSHYEAQSYCTEEEKLARREAIQADANNAGLTISFVDMTDDEYYTFMSQQT
jgi:hypothetical protein